MHSWYENDFRRAIPLAASLARNFDLRSVFLEVAVQLWTRVFQLPQAVLDL